MNTELDFINNFVFVNHKINNKKILSKNNIDKLNIDKIGILGLLANND